MMKEPGATSQEPAYDAQEAAAPAWQSGFRRVIAWQKADDLFTAVYRVADRIPNRDYWLRSQLLRAASSVSSNIAEGHGRGTIRDYIRFLEMAISSLNEVENHLHVLRRNEIVPSLLLDPLVPLRIETGKVLTGLLRAMRKKVASNGAWQRRQVSEALGIYRTEADLELEFDDGVDLLAPGS
jgi:four helix bundle protein